jgi:hypothetical protein
MVGTFYGAHYRICRERQRLLGYKTVSDTR